MWIIARMVTMEFYKTVLGLLLEGILQRDRLVYPYVGTSITSAILATFLVIEANRLIGTDRAKKLILGSHDNGFLKTFLQGSYE